MTVRHGQFHHAPLLIHNCMAVNKFAIRTKTYCKKTHIKTVKGHLSRRERCPLHYDW